MYTDQASASSSSSPDSSSAPTASPSQPPPMQIQPLKNPKYRHISRSAAKRESVQLLGSIKDLQLHFSQAGLIEHRPGAGVGVKRPGLGLGGLSSLGEDEDEIENRPPSFLSDEVRRGEDKKERRPWKEVDLPRVDPDQARKEAREIVSTIRGLWGLSIPASLTPTSLPTSRSLYFPINLASLATEKDEQEGTSIESQSVPHRSSEDIRTALVTTARSFRRIRSLALSISHHAIASQDGRRVSGSTLLPPRTNPRMRSTFSTPSRPGGLPRAVSAGHAYVQRTTERKSSLTNGTGQADVSEGAMTDKEDVLADLRKAALDVLAAIRALEERLRLELKEQEESDAERALSPISGKSEDSHDPDISLVSNLTNENELPLPAQRPTSSASDSGSLLHAEPEGYAGSDGEDEYDLNALAQEDQEEKRTWEEAIEQEKRDYRVLDNSEWEKEARSTREGVGKWVGVVERLFTFAVGQGEGVKELESWAKGENEWEGRSLERLHAFLLAHLPVDLSLRIPSLASPNFTIAFMSCISDGYILIQAYNAALLSSSKPWGFIPEDNVHDTLTSVVDDTVLSSAGEEGIRKEKEWTFRRVGNLTCFGAALRHRYQLPISMPLSHTASSTFLTVPSRSNSTSPNPAPPLPTRNQSLPPGGTTLSRFKVRPKIEYDPIVIAKREEGWEEMLSIVLERWVEAAGKEVREARGEGVRSAQPRENLV
ncbi:hypothetical protein IAR55_006930 [Kwoniella newhampshirensis]|uniref:Uncharacterized protein n=1 Tax=Kwoniella newhampshirensis TaxID=1651941 RepID=A0AAW0YDR2_9TREE